jgi:hypothetical protein
MIDFLPIEKAPAQTHLKSKSSHPASQSNSLLKKRKRASPDSGEAPQITGLRTLPTQGLKSSQVKTAQVDEEAMANNKENRSLRTRRGLRSSRVDSACPKDFSLPLKTNLSSQREVAPQSGAVWAEDVTPDQEHQIVRDLARKSKQVLQTNPLQELDEAIMDRTTASHNRQQLLQLSASNDPCSAATHSPALLSQKSQQRSRHVLEAAQSTHSSKSPANGALQGVEGSQQTQQRALECEQKAVEEQGAKGATADSGSCCGSSEYLEFLSGLYGEYLDFLKGPDFQASKVETIEERSRHSLEVLNQMFNPLPGPNKPLLSKRLRKTTDKASSKRKSFSELTNRLIGVSNYVNLLSMAPRQFIFQRQWELYSRQLPLPYSP